MVKGKTPRKRTTPPQSTAVSPVPVAPPAPPPAPAVVVSAERNLPTFDEALQTVRTVLGKILDIADAAAEAINQAVSRTTRSA